MEFSVDTFVQDFAVICSKDKEISVKLVLLNKYRRWLDLPMADKVAFLTNLNDNHRSVLKNTWFDKLMTERPILTSVEITSKWSPINLEEDEPLDEDSDDDEDETEKHESTLNTETSPVNKDVLSETEDMRLTKLSNQRRTYASFTARFGRIVELAVKNPANGAAGQSKRGATSSFTKTDSDSDKSIVKIQQDVVYNFFENLEGRSYYLKHYENKNPNLVTVEKFASEENPERRWLKMDGCIHETAKKVTKFINNHDNYVKELTIDVKYWSQIHKLSDKFRFVQNLTVVHNSPSSTHWWMSQVESLKSIQEVTIRRNYAGNHLYKLDSSRNTARMTRPSESMPFVIPFAERGMRNWVEETPNYYHPIFWARKLNFESTVENPLSDIARLGSLEQLLMNRCTITTLEFKKFVSMWKNGELGHRLNRVEVRTECATNLRSVIDGYPDIKNIDEYLNAPKQELVSFATAATMDNANVFLLRRQLPGKKDREFLTYGFPKYTATSIHPTNKPLPSIISPPCDENAPKQYALVQLPTNQEGFYFTVVKNKAFINELTTAWHEISPH